MTSLIPSFWRLASFADSPSPHVAADSDSWLRLTGAVCGGRVPHHRESRPSHLRPDSSDGAVKGDIQHEKGECITLWTVARQLWLQGGETWEKHACSSGETEDAPRKRLVSQRQNVFYENLTEKTMVDIDKKLQYNINRFDVFHHTVQKKNPSISF